MSESHKLGRRLEKLLSFGFWSIPLAAAFFAVGGLFFFSIEPDLFPLHAIVPALVIFVVTFLLSIMLASKAFGRKVNVSGDQESWRDTPIILIGHLALAALFFVAGGFGGTV